MNKVVGIVAEYNPFHNGHLYQINKIREKYKDATIVVVCSSSFTQRGDTSILNKFDKAKVALNNGVNLVVELPYVYSTQSSDIFASAAIKILNYLKVDTICFGTERDSIGDIKKCAVTQLNDPKYEKIVKEELDSGVNYPTALNKALKKLIGIEITEPNDLLALSYIKEIIKNKYNIEIFSIKRTNDFHDKVSVETIVSASNIREKIKNNEDISKYTPVSKFVRINEDLLFNLLKVKILTDKDLSKYLTVDEGIEYKIKKEIINAVDIDDLVLKVKSKRYTYNRIRRMLIHILIGLTKEDKQNYTLNHIKILGFDKTGKDYLKTIKSDLIIQRKISDTDIAQKYELTASLIYDILTNSNTYKFETSNKPIIKTSA